MYVYNVYGRKHKLIKTVKSNIPPYNMYLKYLTDEYNGIVTEFAGEVADEN